MISALARASDIFVDFDYIAADDTAGLAARPKPIRSNGNITRDTYLPIQHAAVDTGPIGGAPVAFVYVGRRCLPPFMELQVLEHYLTAL